MIILLSPAKTLDFEIEPPPIHGTKPCLLKEANILMEEVKELSVKQVTKLMSVSEDLAERTVAQFQSLKKKYNSKGSLPAGFVFQGDVYQGLGFRSLSEPDWDFANSHLRILSGLYGILKPSDLIQPYRLEMGTTLKTKRGKNLVSFWGDLITEQIAAEFENEPNRLIVNLASKEYSSAVDFKKLNATVVEPTFKEEKDGKIRFLSFYGKRSRGLMAKHLIETRATSIEQVDQFKVEGYRLHKSLSKPGKPVFVRKQPKPKNAES